MKNIQVIDGAENCVYDVFAADEPVFALIFPVGQDVAFIDEVTARMEAAQVEQVFSELWKHRVPKTKVAGIHGTLFYELEGKKKYYPDRTDEGARNPGRRALR